MTAVTGRTVPLAAAAAAAAVVLGLVLAQGAGDDGDGQARAGSGPTAPARRPGDARDERALPSDGSRLTGLVVESAPVGLAPEEPGPPVTRPGGVVELRLTTVDGFPVTAVAQAVPAGGPPPAEAVAPASPGAAYTLLANGGRVVVRADGGPDRRFVLVVGETMVDVTVAPAEEPPGAVPVRYDAELLTTWAENIDAAL